jgi:hypothetical protein
MESSQAQLLQLAQAYSNGDQAAGDTLIARINGTPISQLSHEVRVVLMDVIMRPGKVQLDDRSQQLLEETLTSMTDVSFLVWRAEQYFLAGNSMAAETLLEWRAVLCAKQQPGSVAHISAMMDLCEVYDAGGKHAEAHDLREVAAGICETKAGGGTSACAQLMLIANVSRDSGDAEQAEKIAKRALRILDAGGGDVVLLIECLSLLYALAQAQYRHEEAQAVVRRILKLQGQAKPIDEIERALKTYVRLPEQFDLTLRPEGIDLTTNDFPCIIKECCGLDLQRYFVDAFSQAEQLTQPERSRLAADMFNVVNTITSFSTGPEGAKLSRSETTVIDLPAAMSQGHVQQMTFDTTVTFRLLPNPPDEGTFVNVSGISFNVGGKRVAVSELSLKAVGNKCIITPVLAEAGHVKQAAASAIEAIKNTGKDFLVSMFLKTQKVSTELPIVLEEFRTYLADATNFKSSLQFKEKDLCSFFERCARIQIDDPLTRALICNGMHVVRNGETIQLERKDSSKCDLGGVALKVAPSFKLTLLKKSDELSIQNLSGVEVVVPFDAPSELKVIGLDMRRSLPTRIVSLTMSQADAEQRRRLVAGIGPNKWIGLDLNENMMPALDKDGNWMIFGVTSNPISGSPQSFFLRLDKNNQLNMTTREIASLVDQTAMEGFDPADPMTWQWGAVALGAKTLLTAGKILRSTIGDEETDKIAEDVKKVGKFFRKLLS